MHVKSKRKRLFALILNLLLYVMTLLPRLLSSNPRRSETSPRSFLICRLDHIGDVILSTPIYRSLKEKYPNCYICVLCGSWGKEILENNPYIDSIILYDSPWWSSIRYEGSQQVLFFRDLFGTIRKIRLRKFDVFIDLRGDIRQIFLFGWLTNIPTRISYTRSGGKFLLTDPQEYSNRRHEIERNYRLLEKYEPIKKYWVPQLFINEDCYTSLRNRLKNELDIINDEYIVIFNGGRSKLRRLSNIKMIELLKSILDMYSVKICLVGSQEDSIQVEYLRDETNIKKKKIINLCGRLSLFEVKILIEKSMLFIGTDSSVLHLSASTNIPSIAIIGPQNPNEIKPLGKNKHVIYHQFQCSPCLQERCVINHSKNIGHCIEDIDVSEIIKKIESLNLHLKTILNASTPHYSYDLFT